MYNFTFQRNCFCIIVVVKAFHSICLNRNRYISVCVCTQIAGGWGGKFNIYPLKIQRIQLSTCFSYGPFMSSVQLFPGSLKLFFFHPVLLLIQQSFGKHSLSSISRVRHLRCFFSLQKQFMNSKRSFVSLLIYKL